MPKSRVTKRAKQKRARRRIQNQQRVVPLADLLGMIHSLDQYEEALSEPIIEVDGEVYLTPEQARLLEQLQSEDNNESEEIEDAG